MLTNFREGIIEKVFFPNIFLLRLHVKISFDLIAFDFLMNKLKKQSSIWTQIHSHQFDAAKLLKINFWRSLR